MTTKIEVTLTNGYIKECMICDIELKYEHYKLDIEYNRGGFITNTARYLCEDCACRLFFVLKEKFKS